MKENKSIGDVGYAEGLSDLYPMDHCRYFELVTPLTVVDYEELLECWKEECKEQMLKNSNSTRLDFEEKMSLDKVTYRTFPGVLLANDTEEEPNGICCINYTGYYCLTNDDYFAMGIYAPKKYWCAKD